jgi:hypothetical protein
MLRHSRYLVACCGAVLGLASFLVGLEVSATTAASSVDQSPAGINRTLKGDRLPLVSGKSRNAVNGPVEIKAPRVAPTPGPELPVGCEPVVSTIGQPPLARVAGRCLS